MSSIVIDILIYRCNKLVDLINVLSSIYRKGKFQFPWLIILFYVNSGKIMPLTIKITP
jgi:hypothetical protein